MFTRNQLAHLIFWPDGDNRALHLVDTDGVVVGSIPIDFPQRGSDLARLIPDGFGIEPVGVTAVTLSGDIKVATSAAFDTTVVIVRNQPTFEERFAVLERRQKRADEASRRLAAENKRLKQAERERENADTVVEEDAAEPSEAPAPEPGDKKAKAKPTGKATGEAAGEEAGGATDG